MKENQPPILEKKEFDIIMAVAGFQERISTVLEDTVSYCNAFYYKMRGKPSISESEASRSVYGDDMKEILKSSREQSNNLFPPFFFHF